MAGVLEQEVNDRAMVLYKQERQKECLQFGSYTRRWFDDELWAACVKVARRELLMKLQED